MKNINYESHQDYLPYLDTWRAIVGLETAGFDLVMANELSPIAAETFTYNILNADLASCCNIEEVLWLNAYTSVRISINV